MSITVGANKSKFVIFGSGYDNVRADSGDGMTSFMYSCDYAAFDATGQYLWVVTKQGEIADQKIRKLDTTTWEEVPHAFENMDVHSASTAGMLTYVESEGSNLGIMVLDDGVHAVVFDLTTDEIYCEVAGNLWNMVGYYLHATEVNGIIRIIGCTMDNSMTTAPFATIDIENEAYALNSQAGGWTISGFYNDTDITFANRNYGDRKALWGATINDGAGLTQLWGDYSIYNEDITLDSFARDNNLYFPTKINGIWQFGKYPIPPDLDTPSPIGAIGINANTIVSPPVYTRGKTWASFLMSDDSLAVTDFTNYGILYTGDSPKLTPIAMSDPLMVCAGSDGYTYLARYK
ncbi:MAG: hypothetical protein IJ819_00090 [Clostridiales bacterium]|nr:hypothetical protein [Clostridiales bacterium]